MCEGRVVLDSLKMNIDVLRALNGMVFLSKGT